MQEVVESIARQAGELALSHFGKLANASVEAKGHLDLVTVADKAVEAFVISELRKAFPDDGVFGEEGGAVASRSGRTWVIDPIDGTFNFVRGGDQWAVSIGLYENRAPRFGIINAPARNQFVVGGEGVPPTLNGVPLPQRLGLDRDRASTGVGFHPVIQTDDRLEMMRFIFEDARMVFRCCGAATIALLEIASGEVDGYIGMGESTWDLMAALPILAQLGVQSTVDWNDITLNAKLKFACGTPEFLDLVAPAVPFGSVLSR